MSLSPGDIVIVEHIPQNNPTVTKARPALVISLPEFNNNNLDVIILIITSVIRYDENTEFIVKDTESYFPQTGLKVTSAIRCGSICSFPKNKIRRRIGTLPKDAFEEVINKLAGFLAIP
jgi:mRNA-degrading endonuclease toxin of MazEF toxin-antitoxin module